jgi:hypothetical protein
VQFHAAPRKRTTLRSSAGKKLNAERNADGHVCDVQTYKRAWQDVKRVSKAETAGGKSWSTGSEEVIQSRNTEGTAADLKRKSHQNSEKILRRGDEDSSSASGRSD